MRTRKLIRVGIAATGLTVLTACGSSATTTAPPATVAGTPAAVVASSPAAVVASASPAPSTCPEFRMTAAHMATYWQYLNLNLGTTNDEAPTLADLSTGSVDLQRLAPTCAPEAIAAIDEFAATVAAIQPVYTTQPTGGDVKKVNDALAAMQKAGAEMFKQMGQADYAWQ